VRILFAAAEASPYAKVGGLGDVAAALPKALARLGHEVRLLLPRSRSVLADMRSVSWEEELPFGAGTAAVRALSGTLPGSDPPVRVHLLDAAPFAQADVYGGDDEGDRFALFANAVLYDAITEAATTPDIVHVHDWHTALAPVLLRARHGSDLRFAALRTVLTIHNLAYQGVQGADFADRHGLERPPARGDTALDAVNVLGRGIAHADRVTTVSAAYAREILEPLAGHGLDALLRERGVVGIPNGIDTDVFDPATDPALAVPFDATRLGARRATRASLATELGLTGVEAPLVGVVSRLAEQKGLDLLLAVAPTLLDRGAQLVVLGTGDPALEDGFRALAAARPGAAATVIGFDAALAQRIYGGCDLFCMPSRFEPGGLGQLIAMRYGAIPLVRRTGGLVDTVVPYAPGGLGTGFLFDEVDPAALLRALDEALAVHRDGAEWEALQRRALAVDSSWEPAARAYAALYAATVAV
jgi:starch synthase